MIPASAEFKSILRTALEIEGDLRLLAEWNQNRFHSPVVTNNADVDDPAFPLQSIVEPLRPTKGIVKLRVDEGFIQPGYMNAVPTARFYISSGDDVYYYWASDLKAETLSVATNTYSFETPQRPTIIYPESVYTNKIVIGLEDTLAKPVSYSVQVSVDGTNWTTASTNPAINANGQIVLYLQQFGTWGTTAYYSNITQIRGVRLVANTMNEAFSRLSVIEMSARIHNDLTPYLLSWESSFELSDVSALTPIGRASSNTANVILSNIDLRFNNENDDSLYYGLMDKNVNMTLDFGLKLANGSYEYVRQFSMFAESLAPDDEMTVSVALKDSSIYLQSAIIPPLYLENHTLGAIIWKLMDIAGFTNYHYNVKADDSQIVPFFWTEGDKSLWDEIAGLAETTQVAVWFDENDVMRIQTKNTAFDVTRPIDWNLRATDTTGLVANIETLSQDRVFETNKLDVTYVNTAFSDFNNGTPKMEVSWEPEGTMVLRAATIIAPIVAGTEYVSIDQKKSITWPYSGIVNIEGEMIRYEGKHYYYYDKAGVLKTTVLKSQDEKDAIDKDPEKSSEYLSWKNYFSGNFKITERGAMNTPVKDHAIYKFVPGAPGPRYVGAYINWNSFAGIGFYNRATFNNANGSLTLKTDASYGHEDTHLVHNGYTQDLVPYGYFGTRIKFHEDGFPNFGGIGGLHFLGGNAGQGVYLGAHTTELCEVFGRRYNEVALWVKGTDGRMTLLGNPAAEIRRGVWYDLEAKVITVGAVTDPNNHYRVHIYLNGVHLGMYGILITHHENLGRTGAWVRGHTGADFEYLYAYDGGEEFYAPGSVDGVNDPDNADSPGGQFLDVIYGGYRSDTLYSRIKQNWIWSMWDHQHRSVGTYFFDEFTPVVHEVREIEAEFKDAPVLHSYPYITNESQAIILEYSADPFRGKMVVANAARSDAIINGEDAFTEGPDKVINHTTMIYGRLLKQEDAQHSIAEDKDSVRKRGVIETQIESKWIQTEKAAKSISEWVVNTFGYGADEITADLFANPILQVGDLVTVSHPAYNMATSSHKYFVTSVNKSWNDGFSTSVGLKRIKI